MSNDENKFRPIFQILHIKSAWFLLELAMALVTTIGMRFLQVWIIKEKFSISMLLISALVNIRISKYWKFKFLNNLTPKCDLQPLNTVWLSMQGAPF